MPGLVLFSDLNMRGFGQRLRAVRKAQGMTQQSLATLADLDKKTVVSLERGESPRVSVQTLYKICMVLRCSADELLEL